MKIMYGFKSLRALAALAAVGTAGALFVSGCATARSPAEYDQLAASMVKTSFRDQGPAKVDRLTQDAVQQACSGLTPPSAETSRQLEAEALATVKYPAKGNYLGDWKAGEALAQNGRGMTWSDPAGSANGGNCYNCHQISKEEISFGTLGPSLYNYGKLRGVSNPYAASSAPIVQYTWAKLYNAKAYNACSGMPRFGHAKLLDEKQLQDLMALLLDPKSPVNQ
jgi:sulfur-oxidizing protein SoxX